jgi:phosphoglycolate phosphatase
MALRDLVFDLDGTLVDSRPGIDRAAARAIAEVWPGRTPVGLASYIGPPIGVMFERAFPEATAIELEALVRGFRSAYDGGDWRETHAFEGLGEVLDAVEAAGGRSFVVTNKPHVATQRILDHLGVLERFADVVSPDGPQGPFASKADAIGDLLRRYAPGLARAAYVGDAIEDRVAAQLTGLPFVAVAYGYGAAAAEPDPDDVAVIDHLSQLSSLVSHHAEP